MDQPLPALEAELARTAFYPPLFTAAFGDASITSDRSARALAQFVRSMISAHSTFDLALAGDRRGESVLSAQEQLGRDLFEGRRAGGGASLQCSQCHRTAVQVTGNAGGHGGPNGRGSTMNIGLDRTPTDQGTGGGRFKAPSLRNIAASAPYMHDGRFATLEAVVNHYSEGVLTAGFLSPRQTAIGRVWPSHRPGPLKIARCRQGRSQPTGAGIFPGRRADFFGGSPSGQSPVGDDGHARAHRSSYKLCQLSQ